METRTGRAIIWRANSVDDNGDMMSQAAIEQMAEKIRPGDPIFFEFRFDAVVGRVVQSWVDGSDLCATVVLDEGMAAIIDAGRADVRPGFSIEEYHHGDSGERVIDRVGLIYVSVTSQPQPLPGDKNE